MFLRKFFLLGIALMFVSLTGCGGGDIASYTIGGTVSGLGDGESVTLQNNLADNLQVMADGTFTFATPLADGSFYDVTVLTAPSGKTCSVAHNEGHISGANVTDVNVVCNEHAYAVGGEVDGFAAGDVLVLQVNLDDDLTVAGNGAFSFPTAIADGTPYDVTVLTAPAGKVCSVRNGSGTIAGANVTNVVVACAESPVSYTWTKIDAGVIDTLLSVVTIDATHAWAVGLEGTILFYDGTSWAEDPQSGVVTGETLWSITAVDANHVWAAGNNATIIFYNGSTWAIQGEDVPDYEIFSLSAVGSDDVWAGCVENWYLTFDGTSWSPTSTSLDVDVDLKGVQAFEDGTWAVGIDENSWGYLLSTLGESWTYEKISDGALSKIRGTGGDDLWIVGDGGFLNHQHSGHRDAIDTGSTADFTDIKPLSWGQVWITGRGSADEGVLMFFNGERWQQETLPSSESLWSVDTVDGSVVWVVGDRGAIFKGELVQ